MKVFVILPSEKKQVLSLLKFFEFIVTIDNLVYLFLKSKLFLNGSFIFSSISLGQEIHGINTILGLKIIS